MTPNPTVQSGSNPGFKAQLQTGIAPDHVAGRHWRFEFRGGKRGSNFLKRLARGYGLFFWAPAARQAIKQFPSAASVVCVFDIKQPSATEPAPTIESVLVESFWGGARTKFISASRAAAGTGEGPIWVWKFGARGPPSHQPHVLFRGFFPKEKHSGGGPAPNMGREAWPAGAVHSRGKAGVVSAAPAQGDQVAARRGHGRAATHCRGGLLCRHPRSPRPRRMGIFRAPGGARIEVFFFRGTGPTGFHVARLRGASCKGRAPMEEDSHAAQNIPGRSIFGFDAAKSEGSFEGARSKAPGFPPRKRGSFALANQGLLRVWARDDRVEGRFKTRFYPFFRGGGPGWESDFANPAQPAPKLTTA